MIINNLWNYYSLWLITIELQEQCRFKTVKLFTLIIFQLDDLFSKLIELWTNLTKIKTK